MRVKGFIISQVLIESVIVILMASAFLAVPAKFISAGSREEQKLQCVAANVSAAELIKLMYYESGNIDDVIGFTQTNGECITTVTAIDSVINGLYRISVDTRYNGNKYIGTELIIYAAAR